MDHGLIIANQWWSRSLASWTLSSNSELLKLIERFASSRLDGTGRNWESLKAVEEDEHL